MRIAIVSDIHCNAAGLQAALALMGPVEELICAGDAIYQYRFSNEVIALLRQSGARVILGNHEGILLSPAGERARTAPANDQDHVAWLGQQPVTITTRVGGKTLVVVHGSPWEPYSEYVFPTSRTLHRFGEIDAEYVVMGHTHQQMVHRIGRQLLINPGSAGEPRDPHNDWRLSFAILDTATDEVRVCNFPDPTRPQIVPDAAAGEPLWTRTLL
jgi:putative phosphoesterase